MKLFPGQSRQPRDAFSFLFHLTCVSLATAADTCSPWTWTNEAARTAAPAARPEPTVTFVPAGSHVANMIAAVRPVATAGELVCRYPGRTNADVNYYTCTQLANKYGITIEKFFMLNPGLDPDCGNIQPNTMYCLAGYIEPLRAYDGKCGPPNNNATCLGTNAQCCNSKTWTCGKSEEDCAHGTCYEGTCLGDKVYSTDGTCGRQHGLRRCAGEWGDCCNMDGKCGTGTAFCGWTKCQSGNCTIPSGAFSRPSRPYFSGNTTDGTCGGANNYVCNEAFGLCCNKSGRCGGSLSDCGAGCQSRYGQCSSASPTASPTPATTTLGNGIATPTPYQAGMASDCDSFYQVKSTDTCASIAAGAGISLANFYAWNPDVGSNACKTLKPNYYVCVDIQS
ncbi:carbohydrate-binding module family 50 [Nemania serpens]|nr:carbohydrate-binding module family 50 [Nemania serpens]